MTRISSDSPLLAGRIPCPNCQGLLLPGPQLRICRFCGEPLPAHLTGGAPSAPKQATSHPVDTEEPQPKTQQAGKKPRKATQPAGPPTQTTNQQQEDKKKGSTRTQRHKNLEALWADPTARKTWEAPVHGNPITKGSGVAIAKGVYKHSNGDSLKRWEQAIEDAFAGLYRKADWQPLDIPVFLDAVFTVPRPKGLPTTRLFYPDSNPDLDKLFRATGDGISKTRTDRIKFGPNAHKTHFNLIAEDGRIIEIHTAKTYPAPYHTHPAALPEPGVQIRVRAAPDPNSIWPENY